MKGAGTLLNIYPRKGQLISEELFLVIGYSKTVVKPKLSTQGQISQKEGHYRIDPNSFIFQQNFFLSRYKAIFINVLVDFYTPII